MTNDHHGHNHHRNVCPLNIQHRTRSSSSSSIKEALFRVFKGLIFWHKKAPLNQLSSVCPTTDLERFDQCVLPQCSVPQCSLPQSTTMCPTTVYHGLPQSTTVYHSVVQSTTVYHNVPYHRSWRFDQCVSWKKTPLNRFNPTHRDLPDWVVIIPIIIIFIVMGFVSIIKECSSSFFFSSTYSTTLPHPFVYSFSSSPFLHILLGLTIRVW